MKTIQYIWNFEFAAPIEDLWEVLSDTSSLNRRMGMSAKKFSTEGKERIGQETTFGAPQEWVEKEWNWLLYDFISVERVYRKGFLKNFIGKFQFTKLHKGSQVQIQFEMKTESLFFYTLCKLSDGLLKKKYHSAIKGALKAINERSKKNQKNYVVQNSKSENFRNRIKNLKQDLLKEDFPETVVLPFLNYLLLSENHDVVRLRSKEIAQQLEFPWETVLNLFLTAQKHGHFELIWSKICPLCLGHKENYSKPSDITTNGECDFCDIRFEVGQENTIEIVFRFQLSKENLDEEFCVAEASRKKNIILQKSIASKQLFTATFKNFNLFRLRERTSKKSILVEYQATAPALILNLGTFLNSHLELIKCSELLISFDNQSTHDYFFTIDELQYSEVLLTPKDILQKPQFNELSETYKKSA